MIGGGRSSSRHHDHHDDITVRCRIRTSLIAVAQAGEAQEMSCTIHQASSRSLVGAAMVDEDRSKLVFRRLDFGRRSPSLIARPEKQRSSSTSSRRRRRSRSLSRQRKQPQPHQHHDANTDGADLNDQIVSSFRRITDPSPSPEAFSIHLCDILSVDVRQDSVLHLATSKDGYLELSFDTNHANDVLLTFLHTNIGERIRFRDGLQELKEDSTVDTNETFNMDDFTAKEMKASVKNQSYSDKWRIRFSRYMSRFNEATRVFADCACNCGTGGGTTPYDKQQVVKLEIEGRPRANTTSTEAEETGSSQSLQFSFEESRAESRTPTRSSPVRMAAT